MKKNRYSKTDRKEVPSRRKLSRVADAAQREAAGLDLQLKRTQAQVVDEAERRRGWQYHAESMREENERLRKQVEGLLPEDDYLRVSPSPGFGKEDLGAMLRVQTVHMPMVHLGLQVEVRHFRSQLSRDVGVYQEALADHIARLARKTVLENLRVVR